MNQDQRKYLILQVEKTCQEKVEELEASIPARPSLNNYLVAAFLDNSIQFADMEKLKTKMKEEVIRLGAGDVLVNDDGDDDWKYRRSKKKNRKTTFTVNVNAEDLFVIPQAYKDKLKEYTDEKERIEKEIEMLQATTKTIVMKIQIGSSATMDKLVMQIDNMGDLNLVNSQLLLGSAENK